MPFPAARLTPRTDLIDNLAVRDTELMQTARARGGRVIGGRPMVEARFDAQLAFNGAPPCLW